jgi:hypothetical protein
MKITNKMHYIDQFIIPSQLHMFREMFSPIIRSTRLYLQYLLVFAQAAAGCFCNFSNAPKNRFSLLGIKPLFLDGSADSLVTIPAELCRSIKQDK